MSSGMDSHKGQVTAALDFSNLLACSSKVEIGETNLAVVFAIVPLELVRPLVIPKPVANVVCVTLLKALGQKNMQ